MDGMPEEILCDIFWNCLPTNHDYESFSTSISAPLAISSVCRAWRSIALSYGELWSNMCIELEDRFNERKLSVVKDVFDTWMLRSGCSPLSITLKCPCRRDAASQSIAGQIFKTMADQQHRWKDVTIYHHSNTPSDLPDIIILNHMPLLTSLVVDIWHRECRVVVDISRSLRLERISMRGVDIATVHNPIETLRLPSSLTFSYGASNDLRSCLSFLRAAPNLKHLRASFSWNNGELDNDHSHLFHQLRDLKVQIGRTASLFMDSVTLPSLQALAYSGSKNAVGDGALHRFIQRSMPPLTFLEVTNVDEATLLPVLRLAPTLMDLRILRGHFTARFFRELVVPDITGWNKQCIRNVVISPGLLSIYLARLDIPEDTNACITALINMAKSRREVLGSFDEVRLMSMRKTTDIDVEEINQHIENLEIHLKDSKVVIRNAFVPPDPFSDPESKF